MYEAEQAANILFSCMKHGTTVDFLNSEYWPLTADDGYTVQAELHRKLGGDDIVGWKIAATAEAGRAHINVDRPLAGRLLPSMCHRDGAKLTFACNRMAVAEAEFAFTIGVDMPPKLSNYTEEEVALSIQSLHAGLEFPDSRFTDFTLPGTAGLIADNACAWHFVLGEPSTLPLDVKSLSDHPTSLAINGNIMTRGTGKDALGGPLNALVWIANTLSDLNIGLRAGQFVTTGVTGLPYPVTQGDIVCADLGPFGSVKASLI